VKRPVKKEEGSLLNGTGQQEKPENIVGGNYFRPF